MCASLSSFSEISFSKEFIYITFDMRVDCRDFDKSRSKKTIARRNQLFEAIRLEGKHEHKIF